MKDQERQALSLQGKYQNFNIFLNYDSDHEKLNIRVENSITLEEYNQCVDSSFIEQRQDFKCLVDLENIFDFLTENFSTVSFEEGAFKFVYEWGKAKKKEKQIKIELTKKAMSELQLASLKITRLNQQLISRDIKIEEQAQVINDLKKQFQLQRLKNQQLQSTMDAELEEFQKEKMMLCSKIASLKIIERQYKELTKKDSALGPFGGLFGNQQVFQKSPQVWLQNNDNLQSKRSGLFSNSLFK